MNNRYNWKHTAAVIAAILTIGGIATAVVPLSTNTVVMPEATDMGKCPAGPQSKNCMDNVAETPTWHFMDGGTAPMSGGGGGGGVSSITAGTGLTGGTITTSGTVAVSTAQGQNMAPTDSTYSYGDTTHRLTSLGTEAIVSGTAALSLTSNMADSGTNTGPYTDTTTALTTSRKYFAVKTGGATQWDYFNDVSGNRILKCEAGTASEIIGNAHLTVGASTNTDYADFSSTGSFLFSLTQNSGLVGGVGTYATSLAADGASAVAMAVSSFNTWANATASLLQILNNATLLFDFRASGTLVLGTSTASAVAGGIRFDGSHVQVSDDGLSWTNAGGGGSTGNYSFSSNAMDLTGAAEMSIAPTTATGVTIGQRLKAPEVVTTSSAPTLSGGASGYFGTITSTSVTGTNAAGVIAFTTGTLGTPPSGQAAAGAEVLKITFSGGFTAPNGCVVEWLRMGNDNDAATGNWAVAFDNFQYDVTIWGVCSTTTCSMYMNTGTPVAFASTTAYRLGYKVDCF